MHIIVAFVISACILASFHPIRPITDGEIYIDIGAGAPMYIQQQVTPLTELNDRGITKQNFDYSCGSAALATLLNSYLGENLTERQVIQGLMEYGSKEKIAERRAFSLLDMKRFVNKLGYDGNGFKADINDLKSLEVPCIIPIEFLGYRHFTVLRGFHGNHIFLADPFRGNTSYTVATFENMWYQNVIFMVDNKNIQTFSGLKLTNQDLRYIDEDAALDILTDHGVDFSIPDKRNVDFTLPDEYEKYYRP